MSIYTDLIALAEQIRTAQAESSNTAELVGSTLKAVIEYIRTAVAEADYDNIVATIRQHLQAALDEISSSSSEASSSIADALTEAIEEIDQAKAGIDLDYQIIAGNNVQLTDKQGNQLMPKTGAEVVDNCLIRNLNHLVIDKFCIRNSGSVGSTISISPAVAQSNFSFLYIAVEEGQRFRLTCHGGNSFVSYVFINSSNVILQTSGGMANLVDEIVTAPAGAYRLIVNHNYELGSVFNVDIIETLPENLKDVNQKLAMKPQPYVDELYGMYINGESYTMVETTSNAFYYRKYEIDPTKNYHAYVSPFVVINDSTKLVAGVAYLDEDENIVSCEFTVRYSDAGGNVYRQMGRVRLSPPESAKYVLIAGLSVHYSYVGLPQLFLNEESEKIAETLSVVNTHFEKKYEFTLTGNGSTLVFSNQIPVDALKRYKITSEPEIWNLPDPTAATSAISISLRNATTPSTVEGNLFYLQKRMAEETSLSYIFTPVKNVGSCYIAIRAQEGEVVKIILSEEVEDNEIDVNKKSSAITDAINYYEASVKSPVYDNNQQTTSEFVFEEIKSSWAVKFPKSYNATGKPSQVIAMLHGAHGGVTRTWMGYENNTNWLNWMNRYLDNGFVVMDINGRGIDPSTTAEHWGCPIALETIHKAFTYLKENYNVCDKLLIQGSSMGGATAWNYALTYPSDVKAMALAAPATISWIMLKNRSSLQDSRLASCVSWMYGSVENAISDNFQKIIGYDPILRCNKYDQNKNLVLVENLTDYDVLNYGGDNDGYTLVGKSLPCPVRIWHSPQDTTVPVNLSKILTKAYRNGGQNVTIRLCPVSSGNGHSICTGSQEYVVDEIIQFMQLYT